MRAAHSFPKAGLHLAAALLTAIFCLTLVPARAAEGGVTLKVGFPIQAGLTERDGDGNPTGYTYEYLQEVAQYTGWNYEFITPEGTPNESISTCIEMLESGELDLMGGLLYDEQLAETCSYPAYSYGNANTILAVPDEGGAINESNFFQIEELRVVSLKTAKRRIEELKQFCAMNQITPVILLCDTQTEQLDMLRRGEADVMLGVDLSMPQGLRTIARFAARPFYLVTAKGNTGVVSKLNGANMGINEGDPYFAVGLYEKYFGNSTTDLYLSDEERAYIRGAGAIRVAVVPDRAPVQDIDPETSAFTGVSREVFDYISGATGLTFQYVLLEQATALTEMLEAGTVDLVSGMPYDYKTANQYGIAMSRPYLEAQTTIALAKNIAVGDLSGKRLALSRGVTYNGKLTDNVVMYDTLRECLEAVDRGEADFAYHNSYVVQYYGSRGRYKNLTLVPQTGERQTICIGVNKPANITLLTILNKAIRSLPAEDLQAMVYRNAAPATKVTFTSFLKDNPELVVGTTLAVAAAVVGLLAISFRARMWRTKREMLESERHKQLGELSNEYIFEYDVMKDCITLTERSAKALGVPPLRENYLFRLQQDRSLAAEKEREFVARVNRDKSGTEELRFTMPDGRQQWFRIAVKVIADQNGKSILSVGRLTDIQSEREELERLADKANRDSLTGVFNAEVTRQTVIRRLGESTGGGGALFVMDLDNFKAINDRHGHFVGDQVLVALGQLLEGIFRHNDVVGRLGGDEFVVFMDRVVDRSVVEEKCRKIMAGVAAFPSPLREVGVTISIGVAMADGTMDYNDLYQRGDKALYIVKGNNRNGYEIT